MPVSQQPGRKYVPRRKPTPAKEEEPEYRCFDLTMTRAEVISAHLKRISTRCTLEGTKAQIGRLLEHPGDAIISFVSEADSFYHQYVSAFDQLLASSYDYLCVNGFRDASFTAQMAQSAHWTEKYRTVHKWFIGLLQTVKADPIVGKTAETDDEKERQSVWLKFCLFRESMKRVDATQAIDMWAKLEKGGLNPVIPILKTVMQEMSGVQREYMETLFVIRPILFMELFDLVGHESIIYTAIEMLNVIFGLPRVFMLDCVDECVEATGLDLKELFDAIAGEVRKFILLSPVKAQSAPTDINAAEGTMYVAELQRLGKNPILMKKRLKKWVDNKETVGSKVWTVLEPKAIQLGFTWEKLQSGIGKNWLDVIAPKIQSLIQSYRESQKPEDQSRFTSLMSQMKAGISKFTSDQAQEMGMDDAHRAEAEEKLQEFLGYI